MKNIKFLTPFIFPVVLLLLVTVCKKTNDEAIPAQPASGVYAKDTSSIKNNAIKNQSGSISTPTGSLATPPGKAFPTPLPPLPPVVPKPFGGPPSISNAFVTNGNIVSTPTTPIGIISVRLNGTINPNYLSTIVTFEYGRVLVIGTTTTSTFGIKLSAQPSIPLIGNLPRNVFTIAQPLLINTTYQFRIKAVNSMGTVYSNPVLFTTNGFRIGETFQGGIVFFLDNSGQHGLVAAPVDQGNYKFDGSTVMTNNTGAGIGTGAANTKAIVAAQGAGNYAAKICDNLVLNGFSDWFLPSQAELYLMFSNLKQKGMGNFSNLYYWSSTEYGNGTALAQTFSNGLQVLAQKNQTYNIRAVRAF